MISANHESKILSVSLCHTVNSLLKILTELDNARALAKELHLNYSRKQTIISTSACSAISMEPITSQRKSKRPSITADER